MKITPQQLFAFALSVRIKHDGYDAGLGYDALNDAQKAAWTAMADQFNALTEFADRLAASLADAAGYLGSVRTDRTFVSADGETFALQTQEWAAGAAQYAETALPLLDEHDEDIHVLKIADAEDQLAEDREARKVATA